MIADWSKPLLDGGLGPGSASQYLKRTWRLRRGATSSICATPFENFPAENPEPAAVRAEHEKEAPRLGFHGVLGLSEAESRRIQSECYREWLIDLHVGDAVPGRATASGCVRRALAVKVKGSPSPTSRRADFARAGSGARRSRDDAKRQIAGRVLHEIAERLDFLHAVGLD